MFNTYRGGDYHHTTNVKQQPNDAADAARLYGEVEAKAEAKVKEVIHHQLDSIKAEFVELHSNRSVLHFKDTYIILFKVNGKGMQATVDVMELRHQDIRPEEHALRSIAEGITQQILQQMAPQIYAAGRFNQR